MSETPKNECEGCNGRDKTIAALARRVDELEGRTTPEPDETEDLIMNAGALK